MTTHTATCCAPTASGQACCQNGCDCVSFACHQAVIVGYVRSPFTPAHKGALAKVRPDDLTAQVVQALLAKTGVNPEVVEDLKLGCAFPEGEQGMNLARLVVLLAGLPRTVGGVTINRFCGSSMQAVHDAAGAIAAGMGEVFIAAGVESMSRIPIGGYNPLPNSKLDAAVPGAYMGMGETAENVAALKHISRADQEAFAVASHAKAAKAQAAGLLKAEITPITDAKGHTIDTDGCIRPDTTSEGLAALKPSFKADGSVTAGTSSPLTDGAAAVLVTSLRFAKAHNLPVLARVKAFAVSGCAPETMGLGPVGAVQKVLAKGGVKLEDVSVIESNEAFAAQALAVERALGLDAGKVNLHGGALALGHPLGATGARIVGKAAALLKSTGGRYAIATQCIGGGQGIATLLEAITEAAE